MPCSRTQHGLTRVGLEPPTSGSGDRGINHQATALPKLGNSDILFIFKISYIIVYKISINIFAI